jgi:hypothetical protein
MMGRLRGLLAVSILLIITLPDNTVIEIPEEINLSRFLCGMDNTYCHDDKQTSELYGNRDKEIPQPHNNGWMWRL